MIQTNLKLPKPTFNYLTEALASNDDSILKEPQRTARSQLGMTRIHSYLNIYRTSRRRLKSSSKRSLLSNTFKPSSRGPVLSRYLRTEPTQTTQQDTTDRLRPAEDHIKVQQNLTKSIGSVRYAINASKSDRLELIRDLATYEHVFSTTKNLSIKLIKLNSLASSLPDILDALERVSNTEMTMSSALNQGIQQFTDGSSFSETLAYPVTEDFGARKITSKSIIRFFKGVYLISGVHCLVNVIGDSLDNTYRVAVQTITGEEFVITVDHKLCYDLDNFKEAARMHLLPFFYFTFTSGEFSLNFDLRCSTEFCTVLVDIKGSPEYLSTVIVTQDKDRVILTLMEPPSEVQVHISELTDKARVFDINIATLAKILRRELVYVQVSNKLKWRKGKAIDVYKTKDKTSNLMDERYLREMIDASFSMLHSGYLELNKTQFLIEVYVYREKAKVKISSPHKFIELNDKNPELSLLWSLQFPTINQSFETLLKSLELQALVRKLFPQYF